MILVLLPVQPSRFGRATNISRTLGLIDAAACLDPPPDLIAVPARCGTVAESTAGLTPAMAETYCASLAAKAREWGVYIAAAYYETPDAGPRLTAVLLDPDGDELTATECGSDTPGRCLADTMLGAIELCFAGDVGRLRKDSDESKSPDLVLVLADDAEQLADPSPAKSLSERFGTVVAVSGTNSGVWSGGASLTPARIETPLGVVAVATLSIQAAEKAAES